MQSVIDIEKVKLGDPVAFRHFFVYYYPKLMGLACQFIDECAAEDLVQELFAKYWEEKQNIEAANIGSFLYRWIQNSCLNHLKHQQIIDNYGARLTIAQHQVDCMDESEYNDVWKHIVSDNILELIEESVKKLPPKCAEAFRLCYFNDLSYKEVAEKMGVSPRTVETHIQQAVRFLRSDLRDLFSYLIMLHNI